MPRSSWDRYFMDMAIVVSTRGTCDRKRVGAVLVQQRRVIATGYNGALPGAPHCDDVGHDLVDTVVSREGNGPVGVIQTVPNCVRTVHAEANALASCAKYGIPTRLSTAYVNTYPCWPCFRLLVSAGVARIVYEDAYRNDPRVEEAARLSGVRVERIAG